MRCAAGGKFWAKKWLLDEMRDWNLASKPNHRNEKFPYYFRQWTKEMRKMSVSCIPAFFPCSSGRLRRPEIFDKIKQKFKRFGTILGFPTADGFRGRKKWFHCFSSTKLNLRNEWQRWKILKLTWKMRNRKFDSKSCAQKWKMSFWNYNFLVQRNDHPKKWAAPQAKNFEQRNEYPKKWVTEI